MDKIKQIEEINYRKQLAQENLRQLRRGIIRYENLINNNDQPKLLEFYKLTLKNYKEELNKLRTDGQD